MTWPSWIPKAAETKPLRPPSTLSSFVISDPLQPNNAAPGSRAMRRVCAEMQQRQYAVNGWNYACRFRS